MKKKVTGLCFSTRVHAVVTWSAFDSAAAAAIRKVGIREVARRTKLSPSYISGLICNRFCMCTIRTFVRIFYAAGVDVPKNVAQLNQSIFDWNAGVFHRHSDPDCRDESE